MCGVHTDNLNVRDFQKQPKGMKSLLHAYIQVVEPRTYHPQKFI